MSQARPAELPAAVPRRARLAGIGGWWGWAVAIPALTLAAFLLALRAGQDQVRTGARQRLVIAEAVLRTTVDRYRSLPTVLALDTQVQDLLAAPGASGAAAVNAKFEAIARASGVAAIYLMDARGLTLAASNWNQPLSFVGSSYAYRPYFLDALATGASRYFGIGTTTQQPGLFIGQAVEARGDRQGGGVAGVVVVKVDLEGLEGEWRRAGEQILVSDAAGIVFLASEPGWKYRPFQPLTVPETDRIRTARQYGDSDLRPLLADGPPDPGGTIRLPSAGGAGHGLVEPVAMPDLGWTLWTIARPEPRGARACWWPPPRASPAWRWPSRSPRRARSGSACGPSSRCGCPSSGGWRSAPTTSARPIRACGPRWPSGSARRRRCGRRKTS